MTVKECVKKLFKTVEVCGGVCECANSTRCGGCAWNKTGKAAQARFEAAMNVEYPVEAGMI